MSVEIVGRATLAVIGLEKDGIIKQAVQAYIDASGTFVWQEHAVERAKICDACPNLGTTAGYATCTVCKCLIGVKAKVLRYFDATNLRSKKADCPLGKWDIVNQKFDKMYSLKTAGLFRANPFANLENATRLVDPNTPGTPATDSGTVDLAGTANIQGVKYTGKDAVETFIQFFHEDALTQKRMPITVASAAEAKTIQDSIHDVINLHEVDSVVSVSRAGEVLTIEHTGAGTINAVVVDGTDNALTRAALAGVEVMAGTASKKTKAKAKAKAAKK